jgi:hypothetical protein
MLSEEEPSLEGATIMLTTARKVPSGPSAGARPASEAEIVPFKVSSVSHAICMPTGPVFYSLWRELALTQGNKLRPLPGILRRSSQGLLQHRML